MAEIEPDKLDDFGPIAVIGGTGELGKGLAYRFAAEGLSVVIGSRAAERAQAAADELNEMLGTNLVTGAQNSDAALAAPEIVVLSVPYDGHAELVGQLGGVDGKIVVSCVNPLGFDKQGPYGLDVDDRSAAEEAARLLPASTLVGAFHHVAAGKLLDGSSLADEQVLVCSDDAAARERVCDLATFVTGDRGIAAGPLRNARYLEPFTAVIIAVNKAYKTHAGIALTGL